MACGVPILDLDEHNIVKEALTQFRAQVMFKNFMPKGGADKLLVYLTVFIQHCLRDVGRMKPADLADKGKVQKVIEGLANQPVPDPDSDKDFYIYDLIEHGKSTNERGQFKKYLADLKKATGAELLGVLHHEKHGDMDLKYWLPFGRKLFIGRKYDKSL